MIKTASFLLLFVIVNSLFAQEYETSLEARNAAIKYTNEAIDHLNNKQTQLANDNLLSAIETDLTYRPAYVQLYKLALTDKHYRKTSIQGLKKGVSVFNDDDELHFYYAEALRLEGHTEEAFPLYNKAIEYSKANGEDYYLVPYYYFNRGNHYLKQKELEAALLDYNYALKLKKDFSGALTNRAICLLKLERTAEACKDLDAAISLGSKAAQKYQDIYCK